MVAHFFITYTRLTNKQTFTQMLTHTQTQELYRSLDNMRPNLFRMASELKNNEEGMAEILAANESLLRITDTYKRIFEGDEEGATKTNGTSTETTVNSSASATTSTATPTNSVPPTNTEGTGGVLSSGSSGATAAGNSDVLIDLADLDFGPPPSGSSQDGNLSSFLDNQGLLGECWETVAVVIDLVCLLLVNFSICFGLVFVYTCITICSFY